MFQRYGWIKWCDAPPCYERATEADIKNVLQDLKALMIRGEYCFGAGDRGLLDEVKLTASDSDQDIVLDVVDNCSDICNPEQENSEKEGSGDASDACATKILSQNNLVIFVFPLIFCTNRPDFFRCFFSYSPALIDFRLEQNRLDLSCLL